MHHNYGRWKRVRAERDATASLPRPEETCPGRPRSRPHPLEVHAFGGELACNELLARVQFDAELPNRSQVREESGLLFLRFVQLFL